MADIKALYHSALDTITPVLMDHDVVIDVGYFVALLLILGASQKLGYRLLSATGLQHKVVRYLLLPGEQPECHGSCQLSVRTESL